MTIYRLKDAATLAEACYKAGRIINQQSKHAVVQVGRCLLVNRTDDPVPRVPSTYHHMGHAKLFRSVRHKRVFAHSMRHYINIIAEDDGFKTLPEIWAR